MMSHDDGVRLVNQDSTQLGDEKPEKGENINRIANQLQRKEDSRIKHQEPPNHQSPKRFLQQQQQDQGEDSGRPPDDLRMIDTNHRFPQQVLHSNLNFITGGQQIDNFTPHLENQASDNRRLSGEEYPPQERSESPTMHMQIQRHGLPQSYSPEHSAEYEDGPKKRKRYEDEASELEDLELFAKDFKQKRIKMGFTQGDVGVAMGKLYGNDFSQTTISRFEALNLSVKNMCKLKPLLQRWLMDVEGALARGERSEGRLSIPQPMIPIHPQPIVSARRRKKRTSIPTDGKNKLEDAFRKNPKPTSEEIYRHSENLKMEREVVRVWFCNRRQKQKRIQQQYTGEDGSPPSSHDNARSSSPLSEEESFHASQHMSTIIQPPFGNESRMNDRDLMSAVTESSIKAESVSTVIPTMETSALSLVSLAPPTMTSRPNVIRPGLGTMFSAPPPLRPGPPFCATRALTMSREPTV